MTQSKRLHSKLHTETLLLQNAVLGECLDKYELLLEKYKRSWDLDMWYKWEASADDEGLCVINRLRP